MSKDENIKDECFYLRAYKDDNGDRQNIPPGVDIWHSPGLVIFDPADENEKPVSQIVAGTEYGWKVGVNRRSNQTCADMKKLHVEFYISPPSTHPIPSACKKIGDGFFTALPALGDSNWARFDKIFKETNDGPQPLSTWTPSTNEADIDGPGDKCLVGRIYAAIPETNPDQSDFHFPDEPHVAQNNIFITEAAAGSQSAKFQFISAGEESRREPEQATLRAVFDTRSERGISRVLQQRLSERPGFKRVVSSAPRRFGLDLPDFANPIVRDNTRGGCLGALLPGRRQPTFEAQVQFAPTLIYNSYLTADLSGSAPGDAHIFHVAQVGGDGRVHGGLTWAVIAV